MVQMSWLSLTACRSLAAASTWSSFARANLMAPAMLSKAPSYRLGKRDRSLCFEFSASSTDVPNCTTAAVAATKCAGGASATQSNRGGGAGSLSCRTKSLSDSTAANAACARSIHFSDAS